MADHILTADGDVSTGGWSWNTGSSLSDAIGTASGISNTVVGPGSATCALDLTAFTLGGGLIVGRGVITATITMSFPSVVVIAFADGNSQAYEPRTTADGSVTITCGLALNQTNLDDLQLLITAFVHGSASISFTVKDVTITVSDEPGPSLSSNDFWIQSFGRDNAPSWYVAPAGGDDGNDGKSPWTAFATVAHAIDFAGDGDIVRLLRGTHLNCNVVFNKRISLIGAGRDHTIIQSAAEPGQPILRVQSGGVSIKDMTLDNVDQGDTSNCIYFDPLIVYGSDTSVGAQDIHVENVACYFSGCTGLGIDQSAMAAWPSDVGGKVFIRRCVFIATEGVALYIIDGSVVEVEDCTFIGPSGVIFEDGGFPSSGRFRNCIFKIAAPSGWSTDNELFAFKAGGFDNLSLENARITLKASSSYTGYAINVFGSAPTSVGAGRLNFEILGTSVDTTPDHTALRVAGSANVSIRDSSLIRRITVEDSATVT